MLRGVVLGLAALVAWFCAASAQEPIEPLTLELKSSRDLCTAGTLTEISWEISGGVAPYRLTIAGERVDPDRASVRVQCGVPLDGPSTGFWGIDQRIRVQGGITDAQGTTSMASTTVALAYPLPPPWEFTVATRALAANLRPNLQSRDTSSLNRDDETPLYLFRWRERGAREWTYEQHTPTARNSWRHETPHPGATYELQIAELRDRIEAVSPAALRWSAVQSILTTSRATEVTAKVTHDTIALSWRSDVPSGGVGISISPVPEIDHGAKRTGGGGLASFGPEQSVHDEVFDGAESNSRYSIQLWNSSRLKADASFDIRTAPAPRDWARQVRAPQNVRASVGTGARSAILYVEWDPPAEPTDQLGWASAYELGKRGDGTLKDSWREGPQRMALLGVRPGKTYVVTVHYHYSFSSERAKLLVHIPPRDDEVWIGQQGLPDVNVSWTPTPRLRQDPRRGFIASWSSGYRYELAEVEWTGNGRTQSVRGISPIQIDPAEPGEYAFRARFRRNGLWTKWTQTIVAATTPRPPQSVEISDRIDGLLISWPTYDSFTPIDGYRVHLSREDGAEQVFDVRNAHNVLAPLPLEKANYQIRVAAYSVQFGEGRSTDPQEFVRNARLRLRTGYQGTCDPHSGLPALIRWEIDGGAAPYTLQVGDQAPITTLARSGSVTNHCERDRGTDDQRSERVGLTVTDAFGASAVVDHVVRRLEAPPDGTVRTIDITELGPYSVHRTEVRLSWSCQAWSVFRSEEFPPATFVLRWRSSPAGDWAYRDATTSVSESDRMCRWIWAGLAPGTEYQFQVAAWRTIDELQAPEQLSWTPVTTIVTLNDPTGVQTEYSDGNVIVSWRAQPDAWAYVVALRGDEVSWWRFHHATGGAEERAIFRDLPHDGPYEVEVTTPPQMQGEDVPKPGWMAIIPYDR